LLSFTVFQKEKKKKEKEEKRGKILKLCAQQRED
jgi:hypothetical protein